jgi:phosphoserine aminotransferase
MQMTKTKVHNFSAGPGILPQEVLKQASEAIIDFNHSGLSLIEVSHRDKDFMGVMDEARVLVKEILGVPEGYSVVYLQGGASLQFCMVPFNLLRPEGSAAYINTGVWAKKAQVEAKMLGNVNVIASSEDKNHSYIPKNVVCPKDVDYLHITTNNTIYGTQYKNIPQCDCTLVADMSSDIFSKPVDVSKFGLIYAGAQKNMGPAGATLVIVKNDILGKTNRKIPSMLDYKVHIENDSMFNTPPVFAVYVCMLTLRWIKSIGGLKEMQKRNEEKAALLYNEIDRNSLFKGTAEKEDRSLMNVTFVTNKTEHEAEFHKYLKQANISGLKGHRSVGGFRASIYNAMPIESLEVLVDVMREFERNNG